MEGYIAYGNPGGGSCWPPYQIALNVFAHPNSGNPFDCADVEGFAFDTNVPENASISVTFEEDTSSPCSGTPMFTTYTCYKNDALPALGCVQEGSDWIERTIISEHLTEKACQAACDAQHDTTGPITTPPPTTPPPTTPPLTTPPSTTPPATTPTPTTATPTTPPATTPPTTTAPPCQCPGTAGTYWFDSEAEAYQYRDVFPTLVITNNACYPYPACGLGTCTYGNPDVRYDTLAGKWWIYWTLSIDGCAPA